MTHMREGNLLAASRVVYRRQRTTSRIFILFRKEENSLSLAEKRDNLVVHYLLNGMPESGNWIRPSRLPSGYTELEYIQNPSTAYINTNIYASTLTRLEEDISIDVITRQVRLFGSQSDSADNQCFTVYISDGLKYGFGIKDGSGQWSWSTIEPVVDRRVKIVVDHKIHKLLIDDYHLHYEANLPTPTKNSLYTISLPGHSNGSQPAQCKIYNFKLFENGVSLASMIPAKRNNDNKIGLYDVIRQQFFSSASAVEFIAGPVVGSIKPSMFTTEYNAAGTGMTGKANVAIDTLCQKTTPIRYKGYYLFGSNNIDCGKDVLLAQCKDALTISWWGSMSNWTNYNRAISCTEGGGFNFEPSNGKMGFQCYFSGGYHGVVSTTTLANLSSGWHLFTGTCDGTVAKIYIDGELDATGSTYTKGQITYPANLQLAQEAYSVSGGSFSGGSLSDVRIYSVALSAAEIKELYDMGHTA